MMFFIDTSIFVDSYGWVDYGKINHRGHGGHRELLFFSVLSVVFQNTCQKITKSRIWCCCYDHRN
jgi:hypothetical protein